MPNLKYKCELCETSLIDKHSPCYNCEVKKREAVELYNAGMLPAEIFFQTGICLLIKNQIETKKTVVHNQ